MMEPRTEHGWLLDLQNTLKLVRDLAFVLIAWLYLVGFTYYYFYTANLGLTFSLNGLPVYQLLAYAFIPLGQPSFAIGVFVVIVVLVGEAFDWLRPVGAWLRRKLRRGQAPTGLQNDVVPGGSISDTAVGPPVGFRRGRILAAIFLLVSVFSADWVGQYRAQHPVDTYTVMQIRADVADQYPKCFLNAAKDGDLDLALDTPDAYIVRVWQRDVKASDKVNLFVVRKQDVVYYGLATPPIP